MKKKADRLESCIIESLDKLGRSRAQRTCVCLSTSAMIPTLQYPSHVIVEYLLKMTPPRSGKADTSPLCS